MLMDGCLASESEEKLQMGVLKRAENCDRRAKKGDTVAVHYDGRLVDGSQFDSSYDRGEPFTVTIGQGMVIKGWDQGLVGMCVGEIRKLVRRETPPILDRVFCCFFLFYLFLIGISLRMIPPDYTTITRIRRSPESENPRWIHPEIQSRDGSIR